MKSKRIILALAAALIFQAVFFSRPLFAVQLIVDKNNPSCAQPACFVRITDAITFALQSLATPTTTTYSIMVEPGVYDEAITLSTGIPVAGRETARTILNGTGSGAVVTANGVTGANISNFTFTNAGVGVLVTANSSISITNNVFFCGLSGTGVQVQASPSTSVNNNTFYQNGVAIQADADITITNNIFSQNSANISQAVSGLTQNLISYNAFNPFPLSGPTGTNFIPNVLLPNQNPDPLFVNPGVQPPDMDLHLKELSPCIDTGSQSIIDAVDRTRSDIGAYGGPNADLIPFPVTNVNVSKPDEASIAISWSPNLNYLIAGYHVWYGKTSGVYDGTEALEGPSPIETTDISMTLTGLSGSPSVTALGVPSLDPPKIQNESLGLSWSAVLGASGYRIYYSTSPFGPGTDIQFPFDFPPIDVDNTTSYTLTGLTNGQKYFVAISAVSRTTYYVAVTVFDNVAATRIPGQTDESAYFKEFPVGLGAASEGAISNLQNEFPDVIVAQPALPNSGQGCFIATAAYGHYSSPQVQALRDFRDAYLLGSGPGKAFVDWYYAHSPTAAAWLTAHPEYKPFVRTALAPAVGMSLVMTRTPFLFKAAACVLLVLSAGFMVHRRKRPSRS